MAAEHCFHDDQKALSVDPPRARERCCYCNATRARYGVYRLVDGHGPHVAVQEVETKYTDASRPCVER